MKNPYYKQYNSDDEFTEVLRLGYGFIVYKLPDNISFRIIDDESKKTFNWYYTTGTITGANSVKIGKCFDPEDCAIFLKEYCKHVL